MDEVLIDEVHKYSVLYDLSHPKYMDSEFKNKIWQKIGERIRKDGHTCKSRWNNIRDNYRKSLKKAKSRLGYKKVKPYKYGIQLAFLRRHFDETKCDINTNNKMDDEEDTKSILDCLFETENGDVNKNTNGLFESTDRVEKCSATGDSAHAILSSLQQEAHPVEAFLCAIAPTLKSLSPYQWYLAKSELFKTVQKFELKMILQGKSNENLYGVNVQRPLHLIDQSPEGFHEQDVKYISQIASNLSVSHDLTATKFINCVNELLSNKPNE